MPETNNQLYISYPNCATEPSVLPFFVLQFIHPHHKLNLLRFSQRARKIFLNLLRFLHLSLEPSASSFPIPQHTYNPSYKSSTWSHQSSFRFLSLPHSKTMITVITESKKLFHKLTHQFHSLLKAIHSSPFLSTAFDSLDQMLDSRDCTNN